MPGSSPTVHIHYLRPPDRVEIFTQSLLLDDPGVKITLASYVDVERPMTIDGLVALERGSKAVWFTFPGAWHDVGRFHRADGTFTGCYTNILTPPTFHDGGIWRTTDLFLDVWIPSGGVATVLDEDELQEAEANGWVDAATADRTRQEAADLIEKAEAGVWPPPIVEEWTLEKALSTL